MTRETYFSIAFTNDDPNYSTEIEVAEHDNSIELDDEIIESMGNHFKTRNEAEAARQRIVEVLGLTEG